mgnify:CR=1 FL=1
MDWGGIFLQSIFIKLICMVNFIHYNKYSEFKTALDAGSLNDDSIIFIKDAK